MKMVEKPIFPLLLSMIGATLVIISGLVIVAFITLISVSALIMEEVIGEIPIIGSISAYLVGLVFEEIIISLAVFGICPIVIGILMFIGAVIMNSTNKSRVKRGSIIVIIFSIIAVFLGGGFYIGSILGIIGGILGLVWKPSKAVLPPPPSY
ncbi:MAG: hypothetical protein FGF52_06080 [Candidatus Brockarchaeota archaeon]|nr:hypothetical protein [Candidatus Brockarchaeota archaeon]